MMTMTMTMTMTSKITIPRDCKQ